MDIYTSKNLITAVSVINNQTYLGVNDLYTKKNYLLVGNKQIDFPDIASFIYVMNVKPYIASMKSALNDSQESYYLLSSDNFTKQAGKIMLSEQK